MTKKLSIKSVLFFLLTSSIFLSCNVDKKRKIEEVPIQLNEETVTIFGHQIERAIYNDDANFFNGAIDTNFIKEKISENSLIYSSLDAEFGKALFKQAIHQGDFVLKEFNEGGHFKLISYYEKENKHHLIFRLYSNWSIYIEDYEVDTVNNELKIKEGFNYNLGISFTDKVKYSMLYSILLKTDSKGIISLFLQIDSLIQKEKIAAALELLTTNEALLKEYPYYQQQLIQVQYLHNPKGFIDFLEGLHLDKRCELVHKLLFYSNNGHVEESYATIDELINITGDDPIYLFFYGRAHFLAKKYKDALICYEEAEKGLPLFWDLWYSKLEVYYNLKQVDAFIETLRLSEEHYGMDKREMLELTEEEFPKVYKKVSEVFEKDF